MLSKFKNFIESGELLRRIVLRKEEVKRITRLSYYHIFETEPNFDFGHEIANDFEINQLYYQLEKL